jgi:hypothetical protein
VCYTLCVESVVGGGGTSDTIEDISTIWPNSAENDCTAMNLCSHLTKNCPTSQRGVVRRQKASQSALPRGASETRVAAKNKHCSISLRGWLALSTVLLQKTSKYT